MGDDSDSDAPETGGLGDDGAPQDPGERDDERGQDSGGPETDSVTEQTVSTLRSFGSALGGWARRVGSLISEVSSGSGIPEELRGPLDAVRTLRMNGQFTDARVRLDGLLRAHPDNEPVRASYGITLVAQTTIANTGAGELGELIDELAKRRKKPPYLALLEATRHLLRGEPDNALDFLRRSHRSLDDLPEVLEEEYRFFTHLLATSAQSRRGRNDRALLELHRTRVELPENAGPALRHHLMLEGISVLLAEDHLDEAAAWLQTMMATDADTDGAEGDEPSPAPAEAAVDPRALTTAIMARSWLARTLAAKGDPAGARDLLSDLPDEPVWYETRIRVALCTEVDDDTRTIALRHLQSDPSSWARQRMWALSELAYFDRGSASDTPPIPAATASAIIEAIVQAHGAAPAELRDRHLQELGHVALRLDHLDGGTAMALLRARVEDNPDTAPEEVRLALARADLRAQDQERVDAHFIPGPPPRYRAQPDLGGPHGPDEISPLRHPMTRTTTLRSQIALATAEYCLARDQSDSAQEFLVEALAEAPRLRRAHALMTRLASAVPSARLEDHLSSATRVLAAIPNHIMGVSLQPVQGALSGVIAARERLARPLTIAIMGEFSSGKSTFVNALLGEAIAPMGVLPTTSTINVFRRGPSGGARVHYRDGSISTLARDEVQRFLHGLDDVEASRIRHMEIERTGARMGDAAVVDTPGLNALDGFHEKVARGFLDEADAVVWIFSATGAGASSEAGLLNAMRADGRHVLGVINKVDTLDDDEREELVEYLQEKFGDVLVAAIPVSANLALEHRMGESKGPDDPFAPIEKALEEHFLGHARELKREVTIRRLRDALGVARGAVQVAVDALAAKAKGAEAPGQHESADMGAALHAFGDRVADIVLDLDDLLTRESLALGVLSRKGASKAKTMTVQDDAYLNTVIRDAALRAVQGALGELSRANASPVLTEVLGRQLIPWSRGYLDSLDASGFFTTVIREHGDTARKGEEALRMQLRVSLRPIAESWRRFVRSLERELRRSLAQRRRRAASAPRAEILRLQTTALASIDSLLAGLDKLDPKTS